MPAKKRKSRRRSTPIQRKAAKERKKALDRAYVARKRVGNGKKEYNEYQKYLMRQIRSERRLERIRYQKFFDVCRRKAVRIMEELKKVGLAKDV
ncbi:MAG TPA: hypothetical protein VIT91_07600 [Chthoniobacterales bacterium]